MKIKTVKTVITAAVTGAFLTIAGSSLAFGADWVCPRGYENCQDYEYCTTHDHGDCAGYWSEEGDWVCPDGTHSYCASSGDKSSGTTTRGNGHHGNGYHGNGHHGGDRRGSAHHNGGCGSRRG